MHSFAIGEQFTEIDFIDVRYRRFFLKILQYRYLIINLTLVIKLRDIERERKRMRAQYTTTIKILYSQSVLLFVPRMVFKCTREQS